MQGRAAYSESVEFSVLAPDGASGVMVRLCRYPDNGVSWVWVQAFLPDAMWSYTSDTLPCGAAHTDLKAAHALYRQEDGVTLMMERDGLRGKPRDAIVSVGVMSHRLENGCAPHGPGTEPLTIHGEFAPEAADVGLLPGRSEVKGTGHAEVTIGGRSVRIAGYAKLHEQLQTAPRFVDPFVYMYGWGEGLAFTIIKAIPGSGGFLVKDGTVHKLSGFDIVAPASERRFVMTGHDGAIAGEARVLRNYCVPIFGARRGGQIVSGTVMGRPFVGGINDWLADKLTFLNH